MSEQELGTEKIEAVLDSLEILFSKAALVMEDGKVDMKDLPVAIGLLSDLGDIINSFKEIKGAAKEAKDLKEDEVVRIIGKLYKVVSAAEKAI